MTQPPQLPMPYRCECPHCNAQLKHNGTCAGRMVQCPGCKKPFRIPDPNIPELEMIEPESQPEPKDQSGGPLLQKLMQLSSAQKTVVAIGLVIVVLMGLFPPWRSTYRRSGTYLNSLRGYSLIFAPPKPYMAGSSVQIDFSRLILQWLVVAVAFGAITFLVPGTFWNAMLVAWDGEQRARMRHDISMEELRNHEAALDRYRGSLHCGIEKEAAERNRKDSQ